MTGFGKSEIQNDELILSMELRTVNSRFLDFSPRLPRVLIPYEDEAMKLVKEKCIRGRITLSVKLDYLSNSLPPSFPDGLDVEIFNFKSLILAWQKSKNSFMLIRRRIYFFIWSTRK